MADSLIINPALDQELEDIRTRGIPAPPDITQCISDWLEKSANYSITKLTSDNQLGWDILHVIARFIDGTPVGSNGDWKHLAGLLGLHIHDIIRIENFSTIKGATLEVLSQFALKNHATLSKLLEALNIMERHDILYAISEKLKALLNPSSIPLQPNEADNEMDSGMAFSFTGEADPESLRSVPLRSSLSQPIDSNKLQNDSKDSDKKKYTKIVLLTFTQDGYEIANQVARQIRSLNLGIGVLILEENRAELEFCGECIYRWYQEVDYIIPIITEEYLLQVAPRTAGTQDPDVSEPTCLDARYARLIYVMMLEEYQRNNCLNYRVRPLESKLLVRRTHYLLRSPIFSFRMAINQADKLATNLAKAKIRI